MHYYLSKDEPVNECEKSGQANTWIHPMLCRCWAYGSSLLEKTRTERQVVALFIHSLTAFFESSEKNGPRSHVIGLDLGWSWVRSFHVILYFPHSRMSFTDYQLLHTQTRVALFSACWSSVVTEQNHFPMHENSLLELKPSYWLLCTQTFYCLIRSQAWAWACATGTSRSTDVHVLWYCCVNILKV